MKDQAIKAKNETEKLISFPEAMYLKKTAQNYDVKVSYQIVDGRPVIHIRDFEFTTFRKALECLQHIVEREVVSASVESREELAA